MARCIVNEAVNFAWAWGRVYRFVRIYVKVMIFSIGGISRSIGCACSGKIEAVKLCKRAQLVVRWWGRMKSASGRGHYRSWIDPRLSKGLQESAKKVANGGTKTNLGN
jgi:hypothetical protein